MALRFISRPLSSADVSSDPVYQLFKVEDNVRLAAIKTTILNYNATFGYLYAEIRGVDSLNSTDTNSVIATSSNQQTQAAMFSDDYGICETWFDFDELSLEGGTVYSFNLRAQTYTPTASNYLGWVKAHPDAFYTALDHDDLLAGTDTVVTQNKVRGGIFPYRFQLITTEF